jgi:hypothetical protein
LHHHLVADRKRGADIAGDFDNPSRGFQPGDEGQRRLVLVETSHHQQIDEIDAGRADGHAHLPRRQRRARDLFQHKVLGRAELSAQDSFGHAQPR